MTQPVGKNMTFCDSQFFSICNEKELPQQWKESVTIPVYKKGDKSDYSNYIGITG
jgi:hypothetical protein